MTQINNPVNNTAVVEYTAADGTNIKLTASLVQNYIVGSDSKITEQEFVLFTALCKARKLNPLTKEAYLIKYGSNPAQIVVSKDAILKRAILHPQYDGKESGLIVKKDDGTIEERNGCFYDAETEKLLGGWCRVYRKDWNHPEYMSVSVNEVAQKKSNGELNANWQSKTATMVEKVAKVRALREAFVEELGGMYEADEFGKEKEESKQDPMLEPIEADYKSIDINEI